MKFDSIHSEILSYQTQTITKNLPKDQTQIQTGHWTSKEHKIYLDFLQQSQDLVKSSQIKKGQILFKKMSQNIATRSPSQCRSHHQKFNPFISQVKKVKEVRKLKQSNRHLNFQQRSKQYIRKLFYKLRSTRQESMSEKEFDQPIQQI